MKLRLRKRGGIIAALGFLAVCMLAAILVPPAALADASARSAAIRPPKAGGWFIDEAGFHASAHADMSCADCHALQAEGDHPRVDKLNKPGSTAFNLEACLQCHGQVEEDLAKGTHGGKPIMKTQDYKNCVACHNPHYVLGPEARAKGLRPGGDMRAACGVCHKTQKNLPAFAPDVAACLSCHGFKTGGAAAASAAVTKGKSPQEPVMCLTCHGPEAKGDMPRMSAQALSSMTHGDMNCLTCHTTAARFPHNAQARVDCLSCHTRHDEKTIHDAHSRVSCGACHLSGVTPVRQNGGVGFVVNPGTLAVHAMTLEPGTASCARCHSAATAQAAGGTGGFAGNGKVGAANAILPAKSVLCMGCHAGTFSVQDTPGRLGLGIFVLAFAVMGLFWLSSSNLGQGAAPGKTPDAAAGETHGCPKPNHHAGDKNRWSALCGDVFLQRRLYREAPLRWAVHALIFFPFLFRFIWGMAGLLGSLLAPTREWPWLLLDKDWGLGALLFDLSGLALLAGLLLAAVLWRREKRLTENAPRHDWAALCLLLAITLTGFALEGMRVALAGMPAESGFAFAGYALARAFAPMGQETLARIYGWGWYAHAVLTAATVAYIPFSQLRHMFTAPIFLLVQTLRGRH